MSKKKTQKDLKYSPKGICKELSLVQWPNVKALSKQSGIVIGFVVLMSGYFLLCETAVGQLLKNLF